MTGLYISRRDLAPEVEAAVSELDNVIASAEAECRALSGHLAHFSFIAGQHESVAQRRREIDPETGAAELVALGRRMQEISGWVTSAARVFTMDYFEALTTLRRAGNKAIEARSIKDAIDVEAVRAVVRKVDELAPSAKVLRLAAAHGPDYVRDNPAKKEITQPGQVMGLEFKGGGLIVGFSLYKGVASASFGGKLHGLPIDQDSIDRVQALKAELFTALVVWPDHTGNRAEPFVF